MMEVEIVNKGRGLSPGLSGPLQRDGCQYDIDHRYHTYTTNGKSIRMSRSGLDYTAISDILSFQETHARLFKPCMA